MAATISSDSAMLTAILRPAVHASATVTPQIASGQHDVDAQSSARTRLAWSALRPVNRSKAKAHDAHGDRELGGARHLAGRQRWRRSARRR